MRRSILSAAAPACLLVGLTPASAGAAMAPPSSATATAARLSDQVAVSHTAAKADESKAEAQAAVISVGGKPLLGSGSAGQGTGGTESGEGENKGALIDTVDKSPVRVQVAPWKARATGQKNTKESKRSSSASAALARVEVPDHANIGVLTSDARAEHTATESTGESTSDAADITLRDSVRLVLLHSEVNSSAKGDTYLVGLNGMKIGTREQLGHLCALDLSGVAAVSCLTASGGTAEGIATGAAEVLGVESPLPFNPASAFATTGTAGTGTVPPILESVASSVPFEAPRAAAAAPPAPAAPAAELPRTGVAALSTAVSALVAALMGLVLRAFGRRRVTA